MNDNGKKSGDWKLIIGGIVLIIVLFIGIKFIFWGLERAIPKSRFTGPASASVSQDASAARSERESPGFCIYCGKGLPEGFRWGQFCPYCGEKIEP